MTKHVFSLAALALSCLMSASAQAEALPIEREPGYLLVVGQASDRAKIGVYAAALPPIYASHNAYYLAVGGAGRGVTWLEGPWRDRSVVFGKFPSRAEVDAFWWGPSYREVIKKRDNAGVFSVVALEGAGNLGSEGADAAFLIVMTASRDSSVASQSASSRAASALNTGVLRSGGQMLVSNKQRAFTSLEGDTVFDHIAIASWPNVAAREAYLASSPARRTARLRATLGLSVVASANGVARAPTPASRAPPGELNREVQFP